MLKRLIEILNEKGLDAQSFLFLYSILNNITGPQFNIDYNQLKIKGYWDFNESPVDSKLSVTQEGIELVKYVVKELKKERKIKVLTPTERDVYELKEKGLSRKQIAEKLYKSVETVKKQLKVIRSKIN